MNPAAYQRWERQLFIHWSVPIEALRPLVDERLELDLYGGRAWLTATPFTVRKNRVRFLPPIPGTGRYHELNLRTYVRHGPDSGIWFFSLDASRAAVALPPRAIGLPYFRAHMKRSQLGVEMRFSSIRRPPSRRPARFECHWRVGEPVSFAEPGTLDHFLLERRTLFVRAPGGALLRIDVRHAPWPLRRAELVTFNQTLSDAADVPGPEGTVQLHYSPGVDAAINAPVRATLTAGEPATAAGW